MITLGITEENINCADTIEAGIKRSIALAGKKKEIVVVCGTFFIMKEVRQALGICEPHDFYDMNESNVPCVKAVKKVARSSRPASLDTK